MLEYPIFSSLVRLSKYPRILLTWKKPKEINIKIRIPKENILR